MSEQDIVRALSKDSRASRSEDAFAFINRLRRDHNYTPREIVDVLAEHHDLPVVEHYADDGAVREDVRRAFVKESPTDRPIPSAETFHGYAATHGLIAGTTEGDAAA